MAKDVRADSEALAKEKCIKLFALIVVRNVKFLLSHRKADRFTAEIATRIIRSFSHSCSGNSRNFFLFLL
jgi:hypothetical protein